MRAKLIYEKFTDESDPIRDMGIGLYAHRDFESEEEIFKFLYNIICSLLDIKNQKQIISTDCSYYLEKDLYEKLKNYIVKCITINDVKYYLDPQKFRDYVEMRIKNKGLNEVFTDESDPIHDMGIGMKVKYAKYNIAKVLELTKLEKSIIVKFLKLPIGDIYFLGDSIMLNNRWIKKLINLTNDSKNIIKDKYLIYDYNYDKRTKRENFKLCDTKMGEILVVKDNSYYVYIGGLDTAINLNLTKAKMDDEI